MLQKIDRQFLQGFGSALQFDSSPDHSVMGGVSPISNIITDNESIPKNVPWNLVDFNQTQTNGFIIMPLSKLFYI